MQFAFRMYKERKDTKLYSIVVSSSSGKILEQTEEGRTAKHQSTEVVEFEPGERVVAVRIDIEKIYKT